MKESVVFSLSLRMWSDEVPMITLSESLDLPRIHLHFKNWPIRLNGSLKDRVSKQHYVCFLEEVENDWVGVENWTVRTLEKVESQPWLVELLTSSKVSCAFWVAVTGKWVEKEIDHAISDRLNKLAIEFHIDHPMKDSIEI